MRLFAALPVGGEARPELERLLEKFRRTDWPVRWVREGGLHVTIKFLGEVAAEHVDPLREALRAATERTPVLPFAPGELGGFPNLRRPRVLWAGYTSEAALELLVHRVEQQCQALGFAVEGRPFRPHVTLGRVRDEMPWPKSAGPRLEREALHAPFVADQLVLYESRQGAGGSLYTSLTSYALGA
jgi:2'-5' RNA ligase